MNNYPDAIVLRCEAGAKSLPELALQVAEALQETSLPPLQGWSIYGQETVSTSDIVAALARIERLEGPRLPAVTWRFPNDSTLELVFDPATGRGALNANFIPASPTRAEILTLQSGLVIFLRRLLSRHRLSEQGNIEKAAMFRQGGGADKLPAVPLVPPRSYAVVVTRAMVAEYYEDVDGFMNSGWERIEPYRDRLLLLRALSAASGAEFLEAVQEHQRALARLAKPHLTIYGGLESRNPKEGAVYYSGPPRLRLTGYLEPEQTLVFTCTLEPGEHIQGWEIDRLHDILTVGKLDDGRLVQEGRVIFPDESSARREKRPLLDIGTKVQYLDENGDIISL